MDSEIQHTPGPWTFEKADSGRTGSVHYAVKTDYRPPEHSWSPRFIAFMCGGLGDFHPARPLKEYRDDPQIEADCRLIAAAPDLLKALRSMVHEWEAIVGDESVNGTPADTLERARAAIAKAMLPEPPKQ